ncbi:hypothetical protein BB561_000781 [Smittium simulii]|uniref:Elongator complex protein 1 n=1 Tax=Smittium simulii TaxID=133385 RepID=A0A2T9YXQ6_9FUNG|nr:hypothetical protein BB561_000781 [Smittium simulii]
MKDLFISTLEPFDFAHSLSLHSPQTTQNDFKPEILALAINPENSQTFAIANIAPQISFLLLLNDQKTSHSTQHITKICELPCALQLGDVLCFKYLSDSEFLFLAIKSGEIYNLKTSSVNFSFVDNSCEFTLIGNFDFGIKAAEWSPDEEHLAIISADQKLSLLNADFDLDYETSSLNGNNQTTDFVNVGWGSKQTQFHGKIGKEASRDTNKFNSRISENDDSLPRISWRGDSSIFAISLLGKDSREILVYSNEGNFLAASESIECLEHNLSWRPSGSVITSTEKLAHTYNVIFYERNGLRHYEFGLPKYLKNVISLQWNATSSILAILAEVFVDDCVQLALQLWTCSNYHWYLKQEILESGIGGLPTSFFWDLENPYLLHILAFKSNAVFSANKKLQSESQIFSKLSPNLYLKICFSSINHISKVSTIESSSVAIVTDNDKLLVTPFSYSNVPPPMALYTVSLSLSESHSFTYTCRDIAMAGFDNGNNFAALLSNGRNIQLYKLADSVKSVKFATSPELLYEVSIPENVIAENKFIPRQLVWPTLNQIVVLGTSYETQNNKYLYHESILFINTDIDNNATISCEIIHLTDFIGRSLVLKLSYSSNANMLFITTDDGSLYKLDRNLPQVIQTLNIHIEEPTSDIDAILVSDDLNHDEDFDSDFIDNSQNLVIVSLSAKNILRINNTLITPSCTSFYLRKDFLILTTTLNNLYFIPISTKLLNEPLLEFNTNEKFKRRIERGSVIACVHPVLDSVILQMPRGNLETIKPRPLVLSNVVKSIKSLDFYSAFHTCRTNRIEFDIIYNHDKNLFADNIELVIKQIHEVEHLCLLITSFASKSNQNLHKNAENIAESNNNELCKDFRKALETIDEVKYLQAIVTCYVSESPPAIEQALLEIKKLGKNSFEIQSESLNYLLFLVDLGRVYKAALGLYDLELALLVAQKGHSDPREYVSLLAKWNSVSVDKNYQQYLIDFYLQNYQQAAHNLTLWYLSRIRDNSQNDEIENFNYSDISIDDDTVLQNLSYNASLKDAWQKLVSFASKKDLYENIIRLIRPDNLENTIREIIDESQISDKEITNILKVTKNTFANLCNNYAQSLETSKKDYVNAASYYLLSGEYHNAILNYEKANKWSEALSLATNPKAQYTSHQVYDLATKLANSLVSSSSISTVSESSAMENSSKKYSDAAKIILEYTNLVELGIQYYTDGQIWSEAIRSCYRFGREDLIESRVYPKLTSQHAEMLLSINEHQTNLEAKLSRLEELRKIPLSNIAASLLPGISFKNQEMDVDVMSDTASMASQFSVFTIASATTANSSISKSNRSIKSSKTSNSKMSSKNRKREAKKKLRGRKGTIYEESYLVESINRSVSQIRNLADCDVPNMIFALLNFDGLILAKELSDLFAKLIETLNSCLDNVFDSQRQIETTDVAGLPENANNGIDEMSDPLNTSSQPNQTEPSTTTPKIPKPFKINSNWKLKLLM